MTEDHEGHSESVQEETLTENDLPDLASANWEELLDAYLERVEKDAQNLRVESYRKERARLTKIEVLKHFVIYKSQGAHLQEIIDLLKNTERFNDDMSQAFILDFLPNIINNPDGMHKEELIEALSHYDIELAYMESYFYGQTKIQEVIDYLIIKGKVNAPKRLLKQIILMKENQQTSREIATILSSHETDETNKQALAKVIEGINDKTCHQNGYWYPLKDILPDYIYTMFVRHLDSGMPYTETKRIFELEF